MARANEASWTPTSAESRGPEQADLEPRIGLVLTYFRKKHMIPAAGVIDKGRQLLLLNKSAGMIWVKYPENFYAGQTNRYQPIPPSREGFEPANPVTVIAAEGFYTFLFYDALPTSLRPRFKGFELVGQVPIRVSAEPVAEQE